MKLEPADRLEFGVGICAADESGDLPLLAAEVIAEVGNSPDFRKLIVVASHCSEEAVTRLRELELRDERLEVVAEAQRKGKADAINKIMERSNTPLLVLLNSDARPAQGAIGMLLDQVATDRRIGVVSALPVPNPGRGALALLNGLMWHAHNSTALALNHMNLSNHSSDELVLFRSEAITRLPEGLVNDGAFLAGTARLRGYSVKVCPSSRVRIRTPTRIADVIGQRRRIMFGHLQVWRKVGTPPRTIESMMFLSAPTGLGLLVRALAGTPRGLLALPLVAVVELSASILSILDAVRSTGKHRIWRRSS